MDQGTNRVSDTYGDIFACLNQSDLQRVRKGRNEEKNGAHTWHSREPWKACREARGGAELEAR